MLNKLIDRAVVLSKTAVTYAVALAVALSAAADEIAVAAPEGGEDVTAWIVRAVAWIGAAVTIVRRVTPVAEAQRGLLPTVGSGASR